MNVSNLEPGYLMVCSLRKDQACMWISEQPKNLVHKPVRIFMIISFIDKNDHGWWGHASTYLTTLGAVRLYHDDFDQKV